MLVWQDELYQKALDDELRVLERRLAASADGDIDAAAAALKRTLSQLYELEGSDWLGRGEAGSIQLSAQIAAYEIIIDRMRRENGSQSSRPLPPLT
jgi:hypothetical protein